MHSSLLSLLRAWPLYSCIAVAAGLLWWQPAREVSAAVVITLYLALSLRCWRGRLRPRTAADGPAQLVVAYASQGGQAQGFAERSAEQLRDAGVQTLLVPLNALDPSHWPAPRVLFVVSTYGEGEAPDNAARFEQRLAADGIQAPSLEYAVLAFGDRQYRGFCAFGRRLDERLRQLGGMPLFDRLEADRGDPGVLRHWQHQLAHLSGDSNFSDWLPAPYQPWRLTDRHCLNPGSSGAPVHLLTLAPPSEQTSWRAGDIVEIGPRHAPARIEAMLHDVGLDPHVLFDGQSLAAQLSRRHLPATGDLHGLDAAALLALPALPHREYSISSIPADGTVQLVVREAFHADGTPGLGSGWLCRYAAIGEEIDLRIRSNPSFHGPDTATPLILIGNGTGIAGLRAHLRERAAQPGSRNWLLFGERNAAHDFLFHEELAQWRESGHLQRLDLAFSRDQLEKRYVQHVLRDAADDLRCWVDQGAAIYVCGSLEGMGQEVQQILLGLLGRAQLEQLTEQGRYRRDLY
ncbi:sulfite reductase [Stutzerimonas decontaminans]|uniref:NADPH--hemoprotein reductase n=2 Tax=Stutzerimonas TaxID=2901164 RepID=A0ABX4W0L4_9GAMM|nr:sulfite reductase subunit alpha [Stutzerimonas decontaminans]AHY41759.1 sulfite reductase [Stutzerimonas decontaminans]MCQ4245246.1 sulfite reductase subunit alpha [Stutzerimonas decontaminans]PNF85999.1 sulfite reductase [Stutzerimonas decontaminans]